MKKTIFKLALIAAIACSGYSVRADDDGEINHGNRDCTPTVTQPCPSSTPQNRQASGTSNQQSTGDETFYQWLLKYLGL